MAKYFTSQTFKYFDQAQKNINNLSWFKKNETLYLEHVREPFENLVKDIAKIFAKDLPEITINPQGITRPIRPKNRAEENGLIKNFSHITIWEKKTSLFEWNPGIHIQFGAGKEDNFLGLGLYMVSSRQMSRLRNGLVDDFITIDKLLKDKKLRRTWGEVKGEKFKRFPKGFDIEDPRTIYLWNKQFYLGKNLTRSEVKSKNLSNKILEDIRVAMPFFKWVRKTVGTYQSRR